MHVSAEGMYLFLLLFVWMNDHFPFPVWNLLFSCTLFCTPVQLTVTRPSPALLLANLTTTILLLPSYRQKLKQDVPVLRSIQLWSDQLESTLQDCFNHAD